ncbi:MAG: DegT/DnrJ/EryC1/StrS family aminotransferase [Lachnospiraceae bacterium]|uniref:DegT/DnrJ/EryC1/StrS family aminotransferase n=1 Tax=Candidatus Merdisoma sp. JLR.KK011 TaxID=3114299 RepID=UPI0029D576CD|nr:DegT/DnrJ/EryC1/StrS family aminotransferase [Lachnospiraceae bacterium]MCI9622156.1 DegT/DnrJ/EryC1/StrS family aminotransferase [Lachnospiraceae bacterium]
MNIPFSPPDISEEEIKEVTDTLRSGWITTGPKVKKLETLLVDYTGADGCVCLNSQTAAGEMSLRLLGIGRDSCGMDGVYGSEEDEVITCAYTYTASASVICHVGAKPVLVDCQEGSLEMDYDALEQAVNEHTKAVIPVDLGGIPCDYDRIFEIVERKKKIFCPSNKLQKAIGRVAVIEDAAHALGAVYKGRTAGSIADFTNFSFHAVKNFTTAEGGSLTWKLEEVDNEKIYHQLQLFSLHGQSKDALAKTKLGAWEYDILGPWYKCNMTDIMGALGIAQFARYPDMLKRRRELIGIYDTVLKPLGVEVLPHFTEEHRSSGHLYMTRIPGIGLKERQEIIEELAEQGISANVHYKPLPMHTAYKRLGFQIEDYPNSYKKFENEITLPLHTKLTDEEAAYVLEKYSRILTGYLK